MNRIFYTTGNSDILEGEFQKKDPASGEVEVQAVFTGICRSDIDMFSGATPLLPLNMQGHEGLGIVTRVGKNVNSVKEGDFVATRGEPGFADLYNAQPNTFVKVPRLSPDYILEPVACAVNIANAVGPMDAEESVLIIGSGFLATIVHTVLRQQSTNEITVVGSHNKPQWESKGVTLQPSLDSSRKYRYVVDLGSDCAMYDMDIFTPNPVLIIAADKPKHLTLNVGKYLWDNAVFKMPSPRNPEFITAMKQAEELVTAQIIDTSTFWSKGYDRESEVLQGFSDGVNRIPGYSRGYIAW